MIRMTRLIREMARLRTGYTMTRGGRNTTMTLSKSISTAEGKPSKLEPIDLGNPALRWVTSIK